MYLNIFLLTLLIVFIIDTTDFYETVSTAIIKALTHGKLKQPKYIKPFSCSLCLSWWVGLVYVCIAGFSITAVAYVALMAFLTPIFRDLLYFVRDLFTEVIDELREYFKINS